jgi:histidine triad (HIT) family protein
MKRCIFCDIIKKEVPADIIFEDNQILIMLDKDEVVKGHSLVIWKQHYTNASDLPEKDFLTFSKSVHKTEKLLLEILNKNKSILLESGLLVNHFHFHIYPVDSTISWPQVKKLFDKKTKYQYKFVEKDELIKNSLKKLEKVG